MHGCTMTTAQPDAWEGRATNLICIFHLCWCLLFLVGTIVYRVVEETWKRLVSWLA